MKSIAACPWNWNGSLVSVIFGHPSLQFLILLFELRAASRSSNDDNLLFLNLEHSLAEDWPLADVMMKELSKSILIKGNQLSVSQPHENDDEEDVSGTGAIISGSSVEQLAGAIDCDPPASTAIHESDHNAPNAESSDFGMNLVPQPPATANEALDASTSVDISGIPDARLDPVNNAEPSVSNASHETVEGGDIDMPPDSPASKTVDEAIDDTADVIDGDVDMLSETGTKSDDETSDDGASDVDVDVELTPSFTSVKPVQSSKPSKIAPAPATAAPRKSKRLADAAVVSIASGQLASSGTVPDSKSIGARSTDRSPRKPKTRDDSQSREKLERNATVPPSDVWGPGSVFYNPIDIDEMDVRLI